MRVTLIPLVLVIAACGPAPEATEAPEPTVAVAPAGQITLTLEERAGIGAYGWSFDADRLVPAEEADLTITSFDCGARGRWVNLEAGPGILLCTDDECTSFALEVGGSRPPLELGALIEVRRGDETLAQLVLLDRTATPEDWYEADPIPPFQVRLVDALVVGPSDPTTPRARCRSDP